MLRLDLPARGGPRATAPGVLALSAPPAPALRISLERLRGFLLWMTGFAGAFVFMEPSPYEVASLLTIAVFAVTGLRLAPAIMPMVVLLILINAGYALAVAPLLSQTKALTWVLVSWYLAATAMFFAAMLGENTERRLALLLRGYTMAAAAASLAAVLAYFHLLPGVSDLFLRYGRAQGTFNDPNVLGAFLILPALLALQRTLSGRLSEALRGGGLLLLFIMALLLSFSRAAWGQFAICGALLMGLIFVTSRSRRERVRIVALAAFGLVALALFIAALLSIDPVAQLFAERASLDQSYDTGHQGRFGRHLLGFMAALDHPLGIGPLQFATIFPEDPHNSYLNSFMSGGWLSGLAYAVLTILSLAVGFRHVGAATPWRRTYLVVLTAYVGLALESAIIDSDHWRHYFLILGVLWGLIAASIRWRERQAPLAPMRGPA